MLRRVESYNLQMSNFENLTTFFQMIALHSSAFTSRVRPVLLVTAAFMVMGFCNAIHAASLRFLALGEEVANRKIGIQDSKGIAEIKDLNTKKRSKTYSCKVGKAPLALVALDRKGPNDKPASVTLTVAEEMKSPLVLIFATADDPSGIRAIIVDDSSAGFPWGAIRFVNTTDKSLMVHSEKGTTPIPKSPAITDLVVEGDTRNMAIQLLLESEPDKMVYSAVWEHDPNLRKLIFILPAEIPESKEVTLTIIPQDKRASE